MLRITEPEEEGRVGLAVPGKITGHNQVVAVAK